jgi:ribosomal protein S18 acetylase RimI-like enzyme
VVTPTSGPSADQPGLTTLEGMVCARHDPDVTLRPAVPADAEAMRRLARSAYRRYAERMTADPAPVHADYLATVAHGHSWVAERGGEVVGLLVLEPGIDHLLIENLAVAPGNQDSGIGSLLLRLAEREARAGGLAEVRLYTNEAMTENLGYYSRRGYREVARAVQDGYRRVFFSKEIGSQPG